jgi:hypothetical protein
MSSEKYLREWKHKINKNIIKRIKERSPLNAIPESETIQFVLDVLCPAIFQTRNQTKYFLTIIGECLAHNPADDHIYLFPPVLKEIIREIGNQCYTYLGLPNIFTNIKYKYYDHKYADCRLLSLGHVVKKKITIPILMKQYMLDFLCVAAHYATRYGNSDNFLQQCNEIALVEHACFLKNTQDNIVNEFIAKSMTTCAAHTDSTVPTIDLKNMIYLWKKYLDDRAIPNIIFYDTLKTILKTKLNYDETTECFVGVTSSQLPIVSQFMLFWEETIVDTYQHASDKYAELEIDEIGSLFKTWLNTSKHISDEQILEIIQHFYPDVVILDNKYISNIKCKLWDKGADVLKALEQFKQQNQHATTYNAYEFYCSLNKNKNALLVSKRYFESIGGT